MAAKKLTPAQNKKLAEIGIKAKDEADARKQLLAFLAENDIEGVDDYEINQLVEMAEVFYEPTEEEDEEVEDEEEVEEEDEETEEDEEEEESDDEEEEEEEEELEDEEEEEIDEEEEEEEDPFEEMDRSELKAYIKENELEIKVFKTTTDEALREAIREAIAEDEEEDDEEEEETEEEELDKAVKEVKQKGLTNKTTKPTPKSEPKKEVTKTTGRRSELSGEKWDGKNDESHMEMVQPLIDQFFPADQFQVDTVKQGITIRSLGNNAKTTVFNYDELRITDDGIVGNLYMNRFKSVDDVADLLPDEFQEPEKNIGMFRGESHPCIRKMTMDEVIEVFNSDVMKEALKRANHTDTKMGSNRQKLEESLAGKKKTTAPAVKTTTTKTVPAKTTTTPVVKKKVIVKKKK